MKEWQVQFDDAFVLEFEGLAEAVQDEALALAKLLRRFGPGLSRPHADTLKGSKFANMKELRFKAANGVWRLAYAFDPQRKAILLVAGDKAGVSEKLFYKNLIAKADQRYGEHMLKLKAI